VTLPLSWPDKNNKQPITGSITLVINFKPIKGEEIKREGKAYQKEVEERATAVKDELVKRARESNAVFSKLLGRIEKERPIATAPLPEGSLTVTSICPLFHFPFLPFPSLPSLCLPWSLLFFYNYLVFSLGYFSLICP
jgi:hypothetical protein